ncbi:MAG: hypothetical protein KA436_07270 [Oligoflexales bacterium]|nr:hypothetical protein [Oligoflexales bacterium]
MFKPQQTENPIPSDSSKVSYEFILLLVGILVFTALLTLPLMNISTEKKELELEKKPTEEPARRILSDIKNLLEQQGVETEIIPEEGILRLNEKALGFEPAQSFPKKDPSVWRHLAILAKTLEQVLPCAETSSAETGSSLPTKKEITAGPPKILPKQIKANLPKEETDFLDLCNKIQVAPLCPSPSGVADKAVGSLKIQSLMVEGHTDSLPINPLLGFVDNLDLSAARAAQILRLLQSCSSKLSSLQNSRGQSLMAVSAYSSSRPLSGHPPQSSINRRIDLRFVMY